MGKYRSLSIELETLKHLGDCEFIYRQAHPELDKIPLSRSKILYEIIKFYLEDTKRAIL